MERNQIRQTLQDIFESETDKTYAIFQDSMVLVNEFELDSVDFVSLVMRVEETFHIRLSNEELGNAQTIGSLVDLVETKAAAQPARRAA
jgi:acyl carrier protein